MAIPASKDNFAQGNIGSGLMDAGIGGLAMASTIPFVGKAAELGSMGVRGLRNLRSRMGDGMSGGGGGGIRTSQPEIDKLEAKKKELIKDYEVMTERMPESAARRYYPSDEIDEIDNQIYDIEAVWFARFRVLHPKVVPLGVAARIVIRF